MSFEIIDFHTHPFLGKRKLFLHNKEPVDAGVNTVLSDMNDARISRFLAEAL